METKQDARRARAEVIYGQEEDQKNAVARLRRLLNWFIRVNLRRWEIGIDEAEDLCREIRVENFVAEENREEAQMKLQARIDVIIEAVAIKPGSRTENAADPEEFLGALVTAPPLLKGNHLAMVSPEVLVRKRIIRQICA